MESVTDRFCCHKVPSRTYVFDTNDAFAQEPTAESNAAWDSLMPRKSTWTLHVNNSLLITSKLAEGVLSSKSPGFTISPLSLIRPWSRRSTAFLSSTSSIASAFSGTAGLPSWATRIQALSVRFTTSPRKQLYTASTF